MWVWSEISYIYYFLSRFTVSCIKLVIFYSIITFSYTKYFVHSYTVDVVFTLSYDYYHHYLISTIIIIIIIIIGIISSSSVIINTIISRTCLCVLYFYNLFISVATETPSANL